MDLIFCTPSKSSPPCFTFSQLEELLIVNSLPLAVMGWSTQGSDLLEEGPWAWEFPQKCGTVVSHPILPFGVAPVVSSWLVVGEGGEDRSGKWKAAFTPPLLHCWEEGIPMSALLCICAFFLQALVGIVLGTGGPCWLLQRRVCRGAEEMKDPRASIQRKRLCSTCSFTSPPPISRAIPSMSKEGLCKHHIVYVKHARACATHTPEEPQLIVIRSK